MQPAGGAWLSAPAVSDAHCVVRSPMQLQINCSQVASAGLNEEEEGSPADRPWYTQGSLYEEETFECHIDPSLDSGG